VLSGHWPAGHHAWSVGRLSFFFLFFLIRNAPSVEYHWLALLCLMIRDRALSAVLSTKAHDDGRIDRSCRWPAFSLCCQVLLDSSKQLMPQHHGLEQVTEAAHVVSSGHRLAAEIESTKRRIAAKRK